MSDRQCSLMVQLEVVPGGIEDWRHLAAYHYRDGAIGPYAAIYAIKGVGKLGIRLGGVPAGVIVYSMPVPGLELRTAALAGYFDGLGRSERMQIINRDIRTISRVVIEPRFRGLGLATRLVRETMALVDVLIIEAVAVMGHINPFFEKAGMTAYRGAVLARCEQMKEAFDFVGISEAELIDAGGIQKKIDSLDEKEKRFLEGQMRVFLQSYGRRRDMQAGLERTRFVIGKLTERPVYYVKINPSVLALRRDGKSKVKIEEGENGK